MAKESRIGRALGRLSLQCAARPRSAIVGIVALTILTGLGMQHLSTEADLLLILPKGDPHTEAAQNASATFRGFYDFVTVFYAIDEGKCARVSAAQLPYRLSTANCGNITDEAYVRGMDEAWTFLRERAPAAQYAIDLAGIIKTVNWTNSGLAMADPQASWLDPLLMLQPQQAGAPVDAAFRMPGTDPQGELMYEAAWRGANAADASVRDVVAPTWKGGRTLLFFDSSTGAGRVELGNQAYAAADAYRDAIRACDDGNAQTACTLQWNVFSSDSIALRGVSTLDAHASEVMAKDIQRLAPVLGLALVLILYLSFRDARMILVAVVNLTVAFVWTVGLMGWLGIPFTGLNLTIIPIILGVGIDYGIQMVSEYLDHKAQGKSDAEAFGAAGSLSGMAMLLATVTTVAGLLLMLWSPSVLMAQLAIVTSLALTVCFLFALTMVPALLTLTTRGASRKPERGSATILAVGRFLGRRRAVTAVLIVAATAASLLAVDALRIEAFGNPELNYPPGDRVRDDAEKVDEQFFGGTADTVTNYLIVEGDLTQPAAHDFIDRLEVNLRAAPELQGFNTASLTRVVRAWLAINQGTPDALANQFVLGNVPLEQAKDLEYPTDANGVRAVLDDIFASPFANFMTILVNPGRYDMAMVPFDTHQGLSYEESSRVFAATQRVIEQTHAETGFHGVRVHQFGNNAVSALFIDQQLPWVQTVGTASLLLVTGMILVLTRSWRATVAIAVVMGVSSLWWLGVLPSLGIGLSVGLMLPLVFISAIGSDNALHLIWNLEHVQDQARVWRHVGKAVTIAIATDAIAFIVFCFQTDLLVRKTMIATVASVGTLWLATILVLPLLYPPPAPARTAAARSSVPQP